MIVEFRCVQMFRRYARPEKKVWAQKMRLNPTTAEAVMAPCLFRLNDPRREPRIKFRKQQVVAGWIPDFWCPSRRLVVELDGGYHSTESQSEKDRNRDSILLNTYKITVLRVSNEEALDDPSLVAEKIYQIAKAMPAFGSWNQGLKFRRTSR